MQCTPPKLPSQPPPKLPSRPPPLTINIYKTLPDASNADLPPRPLLTPTSLSPTGYQFPQIPPSPSKTPRGRKRTYSRSNDSVVVPLQHHLSPTKTKNAPHAAKEDGVVEVETAERAVKVRRTAPDSTVVDSRNVNNNATTVNRNHPSKNMTRLEMAQLKLQLIHDMLLRGTRTLTERVQGYLAELLHDNLACISVLTVWLVAKQVTNKTYNISWAIMHWGHKNGKLELMEYMLKERLYDFDMEQAFDEGLMTVKEVNDLMDCQSVLCRVLKELKKIKERKERKELEEAAEKEMTEQPKTDASVDHCTSDAGSADMDLSEGDSQ
ncbi:hypothetical protein F4803DRAFT_548886 [Xylaria telfairii]|nr:hypothetical protein F4803DRAFT_548886 [Xylaria telfairii]